MKTNLFLLMMIMTTVPIMAQNGINYKAVIKDDSGNLIVGDLIVVQFSIIETSAAGTTVYEENHTPTTDDNGMIIVNIGEGTPISGVFADVNWASDKHFLKVQINIGAGLVDMGTTEFKAVPYALSVINGGLFRKAEGWRLEPEFMVDGEVIQDPGIGGIDMTEHKDDVVNSTSGAWGDWSFAAGRNNLASGDKSVAFGNNNLATGYGSVAFGEQNHSGGQYSLTHGKLINFTSYSGDYSIAFGHDLLANAYHSMAIGRYNVGGGDGLAWVETDPLFEIGNGTDGSNRSNALTVLKNGNTGVGINTPVNPLSVLHSTGGANTVRIESEEHPTGKDLIELIVPSGSTSGSQFIEMQNGSEIVARVNSDGSAEFKSVEYEDGSVQNTSGPVAKGLLDITNTTTGAVTVVGSSTLTAVYNTTDKYIDVTLSGVSLSPQTHMVQVTPIRPNTLSATLDRSASVIFLTGNVRVYVWDASAGAATANDCFISISEL